MYKHYKNDEEYRKDKQIEEMAEIIRVNCGECNTCKYLDELHCADLLSAEELYNAGYRKITENAVVLTGMETEQRFEDLMVAFDEMGFMPNTTHPFPEEYVETWKQRLIFVFGQLRKETAEKFAPLRKYMWDRFHHYHDIRNKAEADYKKCKDENGKAVLNNDYHRADAIMFILGKVLIEFDEICKEITEAK